MRLTLVCCCLLSLAHAERLKDLTRLEGERAEQLVGYGVVIGLAGTGDSDKTFFAQKSIVQAMAALGLTIPNAQVKLKNVAAVLVTGELPPYARRGQRFDVKVSSVGDAKSLHGGTLLFAALKDNHSETRATAQGALLVGGYSVGGRGGGETKNHPTVGILPDGAQVQVARPHSVLQGGVVRLLLQDPDHTTAGRVAMVINMNLGEPLATALDAGAVEVKLPALYKEDPVAFIGIIERLEVTPDVEARVVINERTGTVVIGQDVRIAPAAIAHGSLIIRTQRKEKAVPGVIAETVKEMNEEVGVQEKGGPIMLVRPGPRLGDLVNALNQLGAQPRDLISILKALKEAGALRAKLEVI
ncbi:flagellar basal body P-ring protein FlgI [Myxococcota bacterium]|nr:flagellar basal body P-ring protein FlgI [Myxococcota bacterium]MBU1429377.1 flagellar basal body P-ring protein FlgI [Myxococcota bacterium]MBU1899248.1 flagellar basal body P-ring protein FlgI [Myxococcota bacterium]